MERATKYNIGDKVKYLDLYNMVGYGTIEGIEQTDVYEWSSEVKNLYLITHCPYLRREEEILELCE